MVGEEQALEVPELGKLSAVEERADAANRARVGELETPQAGCAQLRQSGRLQTHFLVTSLEQVEHLQVRQFQNCALLIWVEGQFDVQHFEVYELVDHVQIVGRWEVFDSEAFQELQIERGSAE